MHHSMQFYLKRVAFGVIILTCGFGSSALGVGDHTIPIGVEFSLPFEITGHWAQGRKDVVLDNLTKRLLKRLNKEHPHWNFSSASQVDSPATVQVIVVKGGSNEMLIKLQLLLRPQRGRDVAFALGETVLYKPGHFNVYGRPSPTEAEDEVWDSLESILERRRKASLKVFSDQVPLARNPSRIHVPDRTVVLPLSKDRYPQLAWSTFRLICPNQQPAELLSEASNKWVQYDVNPIVALQVTIVEEVPGPQLQGMEPKLVYLKEHKNRTNWIFLED